MQFLVGYVARKEQEFTTSVNWRNDADIFCTRSNQTASQREGPQSSNCELVIHVPNRHKLFSETAQKEMNGNYLGHRKKANPWKGSERAILQMGSAGPPTSFEKEGKCIIRKKRQDS